MRAMTSTETTSAAARLSPSQVLRDLGPTQLANGLIGFIFAATGPVAIVLSVATKAHLSDAQIASWIFACFFINGALTLAMRRSGLKGRPLDLSRFLENNFKAEILEQEDLIRRIASGELTQPENQHAAESSKLADNYAHVEDLDIEEDVEELADPTSKPLVPPRMLTKDPSRAGEYVGDFRASLPGEVSHHFAEDDRLDVGLGADDDLFGGC